MDTFKKNELIDWIRVDRNIYIENNTMFGEDFYNRFNIMINYFVNNYCDRYMRT